MKDQAMSEQPPVQPNQYWPPQPQGYGPPPPSHPAPAGPPVKPPNSKLVFWTSGTGVVCMLLIAGVLVLTLVGVINRIEGPASSNFDTAVASCEATTGSLATATVGFTIKNTSSKVRSATVQIEYRDGSGSRLDTDTAYVRNIQAGDTVRHDESTILDAEPTGSLECAIVGID